MWNDGIFFGWSSLVAVAFAFPRAARCGRYDYRLPLLVLASAGLWLAYSYSVKASLHELPGFVGKLVLATSFALLLTPWLRSAFADYSSTVDEKVLTAQGARLKLLTLAIVGIALVRLVLPYIDPLSRRTSSLEVGLFKLSLFEPHHSGRDVDLTASGSNTIGDDATRAVGALSRVVGMGYYEVPAAQGTELSDVIANPTLAYSKKPMIARDLLIARFLESHGIVRRFSALPMGRLDSETEQLFATNLNFAKQLATPLRCVVAAAELTRDYRLVMLDVHPLIRWLMRLSISEPDAERAPPAAHAPTFAIRDANVTTTSAAATSEATKGWVALLHTAQETYSGFVGTDASGRDEVASVCNAPIAAEAFSKLGRLAGDLTTYTVRDSQDLSVIGLRHGPYPTMATAWLLGGIGGTEAAISLLTRWIAQHPPPSASDANQSGAAWLYARAVIELDRFISDDMIDSGNETLDEYYENMFSSILSYLPEKFDWYGERICSMMPDNKDDLLFHQTQQAFYQSIATIRLRAYRSKISLSKPGSRIITDDVIEEAKKLANSRYDCFPLVDNYAGNRDIFLGEAAAYVGHLQKAYVDARLRDSLTDDQRSRLKEARFYFRKAQDLLEHYQENTRNRRKLGEMQPQSTGPLMHLQRLAVSAAEREVLSGAGPAGPDLARIRRASNVIDQLVGEE